VQRGKYYARAKKSTGVKSVPQATNRSLDVQQDERESYATAIDPGSPTDVDTDNETDQEFETPQSPSPSPSPLYISPRKGLTKAPVVLRTRQS
jgi:hypothetical protein